MNKSGPGTGIYPDRSHKISRDEQISLSPQTIEFAKITTAVLDEEKKKKSGIESGFPIEFARNVSEILKREDEAIKNGTYNSRNPHPNFRDTKLMAGLDFTDDEVVVIGNYKGLYDGFSIGGMPDGIKYDPINGTFTIPEIKIVSDIELHKNNPNLKFAVLIFEYSWKECDTYFWGLPRFEKTLVYLDYRK